MTNSGTTGDNLRTRLTIALAFILFAIPSSPAFADASGTSEIVISDDNLSVRCTTGFLADDLIFGESLGYDTVRFAEGDHLNEAGRPMLPTITLRIALPAGMKVTGIELVDTQTTVVAGEYTIFPAQPPRRVSDSVPGDFAEPDPGTYASTAAYPSRVVEFTRQADLAGQPIAFVRLYPVQYRPAQRQLSLHTSITFTLEGVAGYRCGDYLPAHASQRHVSERWAEVTDLVVNPDHVVLRPDDDPPQTRGVEPGDYDYVIIARPLWVDEFQPLADWKTRKGTPAIVVSRSWIYGNYDGSTDPEKIRAFIQDAAMTWGASYFLLGGDTNTIPYHTRSIAGEDVPNDTYYADYDGDWVCEVHVGRAPVRGTAVIADFTNKVLIYEQNPPLSDYAKTTLMLGFDLYEWGSNEGEGCKEDIRNLQIPADWTVSTEYDSEDGAHRSDSIAYLNQGHHLVNHIDHCGTNVMGVGSVNHGEHLFNGDMSGLQNAERLSILYTIGCWPCDYPADTCIGEAFVQNTNGGGIAFVGNSRSGWYNPYTYNTLSLRYDRFFFRSLFLFDYHVLGACFSRHKNYALTSDDLMRFIFTELTLLGDPELPIWTVDPQGMSVTHGQVVPPEPQLFSVHVSNAAGPVPDATVCLWKGDEVYLIDTTNTSGSVFLTPAPETTGSMFVTVTKRNHVPYLGHADVGFLLNVDVVGNGHVDRLPDQPLYGYGDEVWLIATPDEGWTFDHWSGDVEGGDPAVQITVTGNMSVTAHFTDGTSDCSEDFSGNGQIDLADLAHLLGNYGNSGMGPEDGDLDGDGDVDLADLAQLLGVYGQDCPTR